MNIETLITNSPYTIKATHPTGICKKYKSCEHPKNKECVARYQTKEGAESSKARFEAHGFNVELTKKQIKRKVKRS